MFHWARIIILAALVVSCGDRAQAAPLVISRVTVINADGPARTGMTVVIDNGRIISIDDARKTKTPKGVVVVDGARKFLIPGLWDMHFHIAWKAHPEGAYLPALVAQGSTGVRNMGGPPELIAQRRREIAEGQLVGPRIIAGGPILNGRQMLINPPVRQYCLPSMCDIVSTAAEGREAVQSVKRSGGQFVKVGDWVPREAYFAIMTEARREGLPVAGHLPIAVRAEEAAEAGQKSFEHLGSVMGGLLMACSRREEELRTEYLEVGKKSGASAAFLYAQDAATIAKSLDSYDPGKAAALFENLKKYSVWQCPTLVIAEANAKGNAQSTAEEKAQLGRLFQKKLALTNAMRVAGLEFLAGTDFNVGTNYNLHDELSLLVRSGFTPQEALKTATINPARYLGLAESLGSVEQGKIADLVLLDANPLESIDNTRKISAVVVGGRLFLKPELELIVAGGAKLP